MIGEAIGNFRIVSRIGRGGMGEVYLAEQQNIGTKVAVKVLRPEISSDAEHVQRFFNEARAVSRIQHAGIVKIFDVGFHPASGQAYLVMEFLDGESLARRIRRTGRLPAAEIADVGRQIASVLDATHGAGITHRDLKPDNIFLVTDLELPSRQRVKVLDFGIAKLSGTLAVISPQTIGTMGTPAYMAPEQWGDASKVDWRADIYSLGCVAFEMTTGRPPFVVTTLAEACGKHLTEAPPHARSLVEGVPAELDELFAELLEKRVDDRPQTMALVAQRFEALAAQVGPAPVRDSMVPTTAGGSAAFGATLSGAQVAPEIGTQVPRGAPTVSTEYPAGVRDRPTRPPSSTKRGTRARWPLLAGALAVVGGGAGVAAIALSGGNDTGASTGEGCATLVPAPTLQGSSSEPVTLRYVVQNGKLTDFTLVQQTLTEARDVQGTKTTDVTVRFDGQLRWGAPSETAATGAFVTTRIDLDRIGEIRPVGGTPTFETVRLRSDAPNAPPQITLTKDASIGISITPRGELRNNDFTRIQTYLTSSDARPELAPAYERDDALRAIVLPLPDQAVKVGARWPAGELLRKLPLGDFDARYDLEVAAISKDQNEVLLRAVSEVRLDLSGTVEVVAKTTGFQLWAVFDRKRGEIARSALRACAKLSTRVEGKQLDASAELRAEYTSTLVDPGKPPAATP